MYHLVNISFRFHAINKIRQRQIDQSEKIFKIPLGGFILRQGHVIRYLGIKCIQQILITLFCLLNLFRVFTFQGALKQNGGRPYPLKRLDLPNLLICIQVTYGLSA